MRPAGDARWCPRHGRLECTRRRSRGRGQCHGPAIKGTASCRFHVGKTVEEARRGALTAWAAVPDDRGITPMAAVSGELGLAWRRARLLGGLLAEQGQGEAAAGGGGLLGPLAALEAAERDRVVRYAERAHLMGVQDHWVNMAREAGGKIAQMLDGLFDDLRLTPEQRALLPTVVPARLRALSDGDDDGDAA
jgi:hypothetical protein